MSVNPSIQIIIVDDHQLILNGIKTLLSPYKEVVVQASFNNGIDALAYIRQNYATIDIILTDISMPTMTGIELCREIKSQYLDLKVLILSMYNSSEIIREAIMAEADGYLLKSANPEDIHKAILKLSQNGTYFSSEIFPLIYQNNQTIKKKELANELLTDREKEILVLIAKDYTSEEIAEKLFISIKTVGHHRQHLLAKTNCRSSVGLVRYAIESCLID